MGMAMRMNACDSLTLGTTIPAKEALRLVKQLSKEKHSVTRRSLLSAVEALIAEMREHEDGMVANDFRVR